jgi:hypothetical protein
MDLIVISITVGGFALAGCGIIAFASMHDKKRSNQ